MNSDTYKELIGRPVADLPTPALLIDAALLERNLAAIKECMGAGKAAYRPHVGWKAASSDSGPPVLKDSGLAIEFAGDEHSLVTGATASALEVGAKVELIPSHCDTTVNLYDRYHVIRSGMVEALWPVAARGRSD